MYNKLANIRIKGQLNTHFVITYANGLRETLNHEGYEVRVEQQNGWGVRFLYIPGTHLLQSVIDDTGHTVILHWYTNKIVIAGAEKSIFVSLFTMNNELRKIILPLQKENNDDKIQIHYVGHLITGIDSLGGLTKSITYNCIDAMGTHWQNQSSSTTICAVSTETVNPGSGQPVSVNRYKFSSANANGHSYLARNTGRTWNNNTYKNILFEAPINYTYYTQQDNGLIKEIRTYNKYHLLIDDQQISDRTGHLLLKAHYFFCRIDRNDGCGAYFF